MRIAVDAMGGDFAPKEIVQGSVLALERYPELTITLVGLQDAMEQALGEASRERLTLLHAPSVIATGEPPLEAIRKKKDSSLIMGLDLVKQGVADAFISAGSTGAVMSGALFHLGRIKGIARPALAPMLPTKTGRALLIDCGANADCKSSYLVQFAMMGSAYMKEVCGLENPRVALVNIGAEEEKGNLLTREVHQLLRASSLNFVGNIEPREALFGGADVLVTDGFAGNMVLKSLEGAAMFLMDMMKEEFMASLPRKLGAALLMPALRKVKARMDYTEYGGAVLLGVEGCVIKAHGVSKAKSFANAVTQAVQCVQGDVAGKIRSALAEEAGG